MSRRRILLPLLVALTSSVLLLASASSASGFGFITKWGKHGTGAEQFNYSEAVATDRAGNVYVSDAHSRVQKFTARGVFLTEWGGFGRAKGQFGGPPTGIATDSGGDVYVVDSNNNRVQRFTSQGSFITQWRTRGTGSGRRPEGIAVDRAGNVYIAAYKWIEKFNSRGIFLAQWRNSGPGALGFNAPSDGIVTDSTGNVYVAGSARVTVFTSKGSFLRAWGKNIGGPGVDICTATCFLPTSKGGQDAEAGAFSSPSGIAMDRAGHVFVSDLRLNRVQEFTSAGAYVGQFGRFGGKSGQFRSPHDLDIDARGDLYVADTGNHRVQKFGEPSNAIRLAGVNLDRRNGTAHLIANVPGKGKLTVAGARVKPVRRLANRAGEIRLPLIPTGTAKTKLQDSGRATVRVLVTYTPTTPGDAAPATLSRRLTLFERR